MMASVSEIRQLSADYKKNLLSRGYIMTRCLASFLASWPKDDSSRKPIINYNKNRLTIFHCFKKK